MLGPTSPKGLYHTELLREDDDISAALRAVAKPDTEAYALDGQGRRWPVRLMGSDWQTRILFWRPRDLQETAQSPGGAQLMGGATAVELLLTSEDGTRLQFDAGRPMVLRFADDSLSMITLFPALLQRDTPVQAAAR